MLAQTPEVLRWGDNGCQSLLPFCFQLLFIAAGRSHPAGHCMPAPAVAGGAAAKLWLSDSTHDLDEHSSMCG